jgi:Flp pilus assembly protein TadD
MSSKAINDAMQSALRFHNAGDLNSAQRTYEQILRVHPAHADAVHLLGVIACQRREFVRGVEWVSRAISLSPNQSAYHNSLGNGLRGLNKLTEAISAYRRAFELDSKNLQALNNLAVALDDAGQIDESLTYFDRLIAVKSDVPEWHTNRGSALLNARQVEAAIASFRTALSLRPSFATAHAKLSAALLLSGNFSEGWGEAEWRFRVGLMTDPGIAGGNPRWDGSPLQDRTLLIYAEQGFGDCIQFVRYAAMIPRDAGKVILQCEAPLKRLSSCVSGVDQVVTTDESTPPHDVQIPILSFPLVFQTDESSIPRRVPYILVDSQPSTNDRPRVGLVWAGNPAHANDHRRSCPADEFNALAEVDGIEFFRLQFPASLPSPSAFQLIDQIAELQDFADTAALVSTLDLVISVDTAVAHLAGAMGKPVWILLPFAGEWRWMTGREDSPWYPTARLFRQSLPGDWAGVLQRVRDALEGSPLAASRTDTP